MQNEKIPSDAELEIIVAKAIFEAQRKREIESISDAPFDGHVFYEHAQKVIRADPEMTIISGWALISTQIDRGLRYNVSHGSKKEISEFFDGFGPLSTDSGKI